MDNLIKNIRIFQPAAFSVTVKDAHYNTKFSDITSKETSESVDTEMILGILKEDNTLTAASLAIKLGITEKGIWYHLDKLKKKGIIKHKGSTKSGKWVILKKWT